MGSSRKTNRRYKNGDQYRVTVLPPFPTRLWEYIKYILDDRFKKCSERSGSIMLRASKSTCPIVFMIGRPIKFSLTKPTRMGFQFLTHGYVPVVGFTAVTSGYWLEIICLQVGLLAQCSA
jgi:hypothetical protein